MEKWLNNNLIICWQLPLDGASQGARSLTSLSSRQVAFACKKKYE
jgi:hypothetical protein